MNKDGKSAKWTVQMEGHDVNDTKVVEGTFFYETPERKRTWCEYLKDNFDQD